MVRLKIKQLCGEKKNCKKRLMNYDSEKKKKKRKAELKNYELVLLGKLKKWWNHWKIYLRNQKLQHKIRNIKGNIARDVKLFLKEIIIYLDLTSGTDKPC